MKHVTICFTIVVVLAATVSADDKKPSAKQPQAKLQTDWDAAYEQLLKKNPEIRKKVENGDATKQQIIAWMKDRNSAGAKGGKKDASKETHLTAFRNKLAELVKSGKLTKAEAEKLYNTLADNDSKSGDSKSVRKDQSDVDWDQAYEQLLKTNPAVKRKVDNGGATKAQVIQWLKQKRGKAGAGRKPRGGKGSAKNAQGATNFYAVVIGRLKSKDIEIGEFTFDVDHVSSMYGNRWVKDEIVGQTMKVTGVSGQFLDKLLQIKRGETLKVRSGSYIAKSNTLTFGPKFHVLERTAAFKPQDFGVPPQAFRGFSGELTGKIVEVGGYELLLQVSTLKSAPDNKAADATSIQGGRIRIVGFYNDHRELFADLHAGDVVRLSTTHRNPEHDELTVTNLLQKVGK
jgi:hypothetical protein